MFNSSVIYECRNQDASHSGITVAVSLYNYQDYIVDCLNSVLSQTVKHLDVIVVDDASSDHSCDICQSWLEMRSEFFRRVALVKHDFNRGLAAARNTAFKLAETDFVFVLDADNLLYRTCLERLKQIILIGEYGAAYSQIERFGLVKGLCWSDFWQIARFRQMNYIDAMALIKVEAWRRVGGYSHIEGGWEDYDFWCKFVESGIEAIFVPQILCRYRVHLKSMLQTDTKASFKDLAVRMMIRHPWLDLDETLLL